MVVGRVSFAHGVLTHDSRFAHRSLGREARTLRKDHQLTEQSPFGDTKQTKGTCMTVWKRLHRLNCFQAVRSETQSTRAKGGRCESMEEMWLNSVKGVEVPDLSSSSRQLHQHGDTTFEEAEALRNPGND